MKAIWNGVVIAESDATVSLEGNQYFPIESVRAEYLTPSRTQTHCPWKGDASYYSLDAGGKTNSDAAWYYPEPSAEAQQIKGYVAFWKGVQVEK